MIVNYFSIFDLCAHCMVFWHFCDFELAVGIWFYYYVRVCSRTLIRNSRLDQNFRRVTAIDWLYYGTSWIKSLTLGFPSYSKMQKIWYMSSIKWTHHYCLKQSLSFIMWINIHFRSQIDWNEQGGMRCLIDRRRWQFVMTLGSELTHWRRHGSTGTSTE